MTGPPKYALPEIERRWLVDVDALPVLASLPRMIIRDRYIDGTRLRLRAMESDAGLRYKLGKKYGDAAGYMESITNLYLSEREYDLLRGLPAVEVVKTRYRLLSGSLDVYSPPGRPVLFSVEFRSEQEAEVYAPPEFVRQEVTTNAVYSGYALARAAPGQIAE